MANGKFYLQFLPSKILVTNFAHHILKFYSYIIGGKWQMANLGLVDYESIYHILTSGNVLISM
jgi:hypothetical protein